MVFFGAGFINPPRKPMKKTAAYFQQYGARWLACGKPSTKKRPRRIPNAKEYDIWHSTQLLQDQSYFTLITEWWGSGTTVQPKSWWHSLAASQSIVTYKGRTATLADWRYFVRYQRLALHAYGYTQVPFRMNPTPLPLAPTLPWTPPPDALIVSAKLVFSGAYLDVTLDTSGGAPGDFQGVYLAPHPRTEANASWPHYFCLRLIIAISLAPNRLTLRCDARQVPKIHLNQHCRICVFTWSFANQTPSNLVWSNFWWHS